MPGRKARTSIIALEKASGNYGVGIEWDHVGHSHDLDLQAVIVNREGIIVDCVYYNNLSGIKGAITHTGDVTDGMPSGVDESVWVQVALVPEEISLIIFVVCAFSKGSRLKDVENGRVVLMEGTHLNRLQDFRIERAVANADVVGLLKRTREGGWAFREIDEPAEFGSHFVDIIEPWIGDVIRAEIPGAPAVQKVSFVTDKNSVASLPADAVLKRIFVGIGGSLSPSREEEVDIDVAAVLCDSGGHIIGAVDGDNDSLFGVEHSGDSVADNGTAGDDEAITIDLASVPASVAHIFIVLTVANGTFELVEKAYARVLDQHSSELVRFDIEASATHRGLLVAQLFRSEGAEHRWDFRALGRFFACHSSWKSMAPEIARIAADTMVDPVERRIHSKTTYNSVGGGTATPQDVPPANGEAQVSGGTGCITCDGAGCSMCLPEPSFRETLQRSRTSLSEPCAHGTRLVIPDSALPLSTTMGGQCFASNFLSNRSSRDQFASHRMGHGRLRLGRSGSLGEKDGRLQLGMLGSVHEKQALVKLEGHLIGRKGPPTAGCMMADDSDVVFVRPPEETDSVRERVCTCFCGGH